MVLKNGEMVATVWAESIPYWSTASNVAVLSLDRGDQVWLLLLSRASYLHGYMYTTFSGAILFQHWSFDRGSISLKCTQYLHRSIACLYSKISCVGPRDVTSRATVWQNDASASDVRLTCVKFAVQLKIQINIKKNFPSNKSAQISWQILVLGVYYSMNSEMINSLHEHESSSFQH